jgi:hypothetical protein
MSTAKPPDPTKCVEAGAWTALPVAPPTVTTLDFATVSSAANAAILTAGKMTVHMVGCAGDPEVSGPGLAVAGAMASQVNPPPNGTAAAPSFLYHLGDIAYTESGATMTSALWEQQFFTQYVSYASSGTPLPIFAIAGNHDGRGGTPPDTEASHFLQNFCGTLGSVSPDNTVDPARTEMCQPYPYWLLETPYAYFIGLYTNVANGGILDDPNGYADPTTGPQYQWLLTQLTNCKSPDSSGSTKAVLLLMHYPPYSGAANFTQRGDPTLGQYTGAANTIPIGMLLQKAFAAAGKIPDAIFCAHAHLYQRLTITYRDPTGNTTQQVPLLIAGAGGHTQLEVVGEACSGQPGSVAAPPFDIFAAGNIPMGLTAPPDASIALESYFDGANQSAQPYGFLRVTVTPTSLTGEYFTIDCNASGAVVGQLTLSDSFTLDLTTHLIAT